MTEPLDFLYPPIDTACRSRRTSTATPIRFRNLGFASGLHLCSGSHMAKREVATAIEALLARLPRLAIMEPTRLTYAVLNLVSPRN
jgi:cytochrome P450